MMVSLVKELREFEEDFMWLNKHYDELKEKYPEDSDKVAVKYVSKKRFEMVL